MKHPGFLWIFRRALLPGFVMFLVCSVPAQRIIEDEFSTDGPLAG